MKSYRGGVTGFYDKEITKVGSIHTYLAVISMNSALKKDKNYYPQVSLKECKYIKQKKVIRHITDDLQSFSDDSDEA